MQVESIVENDNGTATFTGTLSEQELQIVVTVGLNMLYAQGLIQAMAPDVDVSEHTSVHDEPTEIQ